MKKGLFTLLLLIITALPALALPTNTSGPWGVDAAGFKNLSTALASPSTAGKTVVVSQPMTINNKTTDRTISVTAGGRINVTSGKTIIINGGFSAGKIQVFAGSGAVNFGSGTIQAALPEWFGFTPYGATGTATSNTSAINAALKSCKTVYIGDCDTYINSALILHQGGGVLRGNGEASKLTAVRASPTDSFTMIMNYNRAHISETAIVKADVVSDLTLDCAGQSLTGLQGSTLLEYNYYNAAGIHFRSADNSVVKNVTISNAGLASVAIELSSYCLIDKCRSLINGYIPHPGTSLPNWTVTANGNAFSFQDGGSYNQITNSYAYHPRDLGFTLWASNYGLIDNCTTVGNYADVVSINGRGGASIEAGSVDCIIRNSTFKSIPIGIFVSSTGAKIIGNKISEYSTGITLVATADDSSIENNTITSTLDTTQSISITDSNNVVIAANVLDSTINIISTRSKNLLIANNKSTSRAVSVSFLIYSTITGDTDGTVIRNNVLTGQFTNAIQMQSNYSVVADNTILGGSTGGGGCSVIDSDHVDIKNNIIRNDPLTGYSPQYSISISTAGSTAGIFISGNTLSGYTANPATYPYGFNWGTSAPHVDHTDLSTTPLTLNAVLYAAIGSVIRGSDSTRGIKMFIKTGSGNTGWVANYYSTT